MSEGSTHEPEPTSVVVYREPPWTAEQLHVITGYVTAGVSVPCACEAVGVKWSTAQNWMKRGKLGIHPYVLFRDAMTQAKAMHEAGLLLIIANAARGSKKKPGDWRAAAYLEERRRYLNAHQRGELEEEMPEREATILLYPVAMPEGADPADYPLMPGQAMRPAPDDEENEP